MLRLYRFLGRPVLFFYALPWLMLLLVLGTVAQRDAGLYVAERTYFSSFVLWFGWLPLPGGLTALSLIAANLMARLLQQKSWGGRKLGSTITHVSALILLLGGGVSLAQREEGFLELAPAAGNDQVTDYHQREFVVTKNGTIVVQLDFERLQKGEVIAGLPYELPFRLQFDELCRHCAAEPLTQPTPERRDAARMMRLRPAPLLPQDEDNLAGLTLTVSGVDAAQDGVYLAYAGLHDAATLTVGADHYQLILRRALRRLPFTVRLDKFHKIDHPGTRIAKAYRSDVTVTDGGASWQTTIAMNEPLRYRGYTLYQSSFIETPEETRSVLAVVQDKGQIFPYLAVAALCLGMLLHLASLMRRTGKGAAA